MRPSRIVVAIENRRDRLPLQALLDSRVSGIAVDDAIELYERITGKMAIEALRPSTLILSKGFRNHGAAEVVARLVSVLAVIGLVICAPLLALIALLVKIDSPGPVLFVQQRAGRQGRPFGLLKFRTMHPTTAAPSEWVMDNIHRITRVGRYSRRFRLDELPQLVKRGSRRDEPDRTAAASRFQPRDVHGAHRLLRTAFDGPAGRHRLGAGALRIREQSRRRDGEDAVRPMYYIKNRSPWLDLRIMFATIGIVLFGQGAAQVRHPAPMGRDLSWPAAQRLRAKDLVPVLADHRLPARPGRQ